jgi:hypothetical protein
MPDLRDALIDREGSAEREDEKCDDERPEIELQPVTEGVKVAFY